LTRVYREYREIHKPAPDLERRVQIPIQSTTLELSPPVSDSENPDESTSAGLGLNGTLPIPDFFEDWTLDCVSPDVSQEFWFGQSRNSYSLQFLYTKINYNFPGHSTAEERERLWNISLSIRGISGPGCQNTIWFQSKEHAVLPCSNGLRVSHRKSSACTSAHGIDQSASEHNRWNESTGRRRRRGLLKLNPILRRFKFYYLHQQLKCLITCHFPQRIAFKLQIHGQSTMNTHQNSQ